MRSKDIEPRFCEICGRMYKPGRRDQRTCASAECVKKRQHLYYLNRKDTAEYRASKQAYARRKQHPEEYKPKPDTIVAIGYAERQMADSLAMAGKVKVTL